MGEAEREADVLEKLEGPRQAGVLPPPSGMGGRPPGGPGRKRWVPHHRPCRPTAVLNPWALWGGVPHRVCSQSTDIY